MKVFKSLETILFLAFMVPWIFGVGIFIKSFAIEIYDGWSSSSYSRTCIQNIGDEYVRVNCDE
ncbi:Uncharacterised protein [Brucella anthropi]|nr:hypothetical protein DR92_1334 [Brucella anthropi]SUA64462.1 Uncharacterised protein [Brucella anthropi]